MKIYQPFSARKQTLDGYYHDPQPFQIPRENLFGWACFWIAVGLLIGVGMVSR